MSHIHVTHSGYTFRLHIHVTHPIYTLMPQFMSHIQVTHSCRTSMPRIHVTHSNHTIRYLIGLMCFEGRQQDNKFVGINEWLTIVIIPCDDMYTESHPSSHFDLFFFLLMISMLIQGTKAIPTYTVEWWRWIVASLPLQQTKRHKIYFTVLYLPWCV